MAAHELDFASLPIGHGVLHLGGQYHSSLPLQSGERVNLIIWLHGKHEVVRIAPYEPHEQLGPLERWSAFARDRFRAGAILS